MRVKYPVIGAVLGLAILAGNAFAQQTTAPAGASTAPSSGASSTGSGSGKDLTIEQLYLSQDIELQILTTQATSDSRSNQLLAIQSIQSMVQNGSLAQANPAIGTILSTLATDGLTRQVRAGNAITNDFPDVRREACNLLGDLGGTRAKDTLLTVLLQDKEPMVLAEAVYALGRIGLNDKNDVTSRITWVLNQDTAMATPDNNLAFACLLAVQKLSEKTGGISDPEVINALLGVASGNYIRDVRLKAIDTIYQLRKQQKQG